MKSMKNKTKPDRSETAGRTQCGGVGHNLRSPFFLYPWPAHYWASLWELPLASLNGLIQSQLTFCFALHSSLSHGEPVRWKSNGMLGLEQFLHEIFYGFYLPSIPTPVSINSFTKSLPGCRLNFAHVLKF